MGHSISISWDLTPNVSRSVYLDLTFVYDSMGPGPDSEPIYRDKCRSEYLYTAIVTILDPD